MPKKIKAIDVDDYILQNPPEIQLILIELRAMVRKAAPEAREKISYGIPAFEQNGIILWFGAFKDHISIFPPINGDAELQKETARFANDKGNLLFYYNQAIPFELIERVISQKVMQNQTKKRRSSQKTRNESTQTDP